MGLDDAVRADQRGPAPAEGALDEPGGIIEVASFDEHGVALAHHTRTGSGVATASGDYPGHAVSEKCIEADRTAGDRAHRGLG
jgi:hypothetical protein